LKVNDFRKPERIPWGVFPKWNLPHPYPAFRDQKHDCARKIRSADRERMKGRRADVRAFHPLRNETVSTRSQVIRMTLRAAHQAPSFLVADDLLPGLIPMEHPAEEEGEVAQDAQVGHAGRRLDIHDRLLAGLDALEPVFPVAGAFVDILRAGGRYPFTGLSLGPCAAVTTPMGEGPLGPVVNGPVAGTFDAGPRSGPNRGS
jgi:hypothetical protein